MTGPHRLPSRRMLLVLWKLQHAIRDYCATDLHFCRFFFQAEDGIRDSSVTGVQTCDLPISNGGDAFTARFQPLLPGFAHVPFNDLDALEAELRSEDVALFITEPIVGHGVRLPEPGYLEGAQALCRRYGTLFCVDEVATGFGRTGRMFACDHWGLEPDVMTVSKALSGGFVPIGACLLSTKVFDAVFDSMEHALSHGSTFA